MNNNASIEVFTPDEEDAMREIVNIAMGQAGSSLAEVMDTFVDLSVPKVRIIGVAETPEVIGNIIGFDTEVSAVREAFYSNPRGEAIVIYDKGGWRNLAENMGYDSDTEGHVEEELLLDVSNVLVGACLSGIAEQLGTTLSFSAPSIMSVNSTIKTLLDPKNLNWVHGLLLEVHFSIKEKGLSCHLIILTPDESIEHIRKALNHFLESL